MFHGVVLAGGRSSRMGTDKAYLMWHGQPLLEHMRSLLRQAGAERVLISGAYPEVDALPDQQPGLGPVGGLLALARTQADGIYLLVPVDMPLLTTSLLQSLVAAVAADDGPVCVIWARHVLPLCLRLDAQVRTLITDLARQPSTARSLHALHTALGGVALTLDADTAAHLVNCNTPAEWQGVAR